MNWFLNLKTGTKVLVTIGFMVIVLLIVVITAYSNMRNMQATMRRIAEHEFANAVDIAVVVGYENEIRAGTWKILALEDAEQRRLELEDINRLEADVADRMSTVSSRDTMDTAMVSRLQEFETMRIELRDARERDLLPLISAGDRAAAVALATGEQADRISRIRELGNELIADAEHDAESAVEASQDQAAAAFALFAGLAALAIVAGLLTAIILNRALAVPLRNLTVWAERVGARDLTTNVPTNGRLDEVGILMGTFSQMVDNLRNITRDIAQGVGVLGSSSSEIMASSTQVAAGAAETASAISQTTSTVEEVKQTATMASQKAKAVSEQSQRANETAQQGATAVRDVQDGMRQIHEQMNSIAESITRLSEHGQSIGAIIQSVDDLSEQSNLLSVNAAIEAAKAGENGRGFSVVADEMRSLAEQSKDATKQVRQILNDIQRGVSTAGMATERGARSVESGLKMSEEAGKTIEMLLTSVTESAQAAIQIAASSQQQLAGMGQVAGAMDNIRDASEQNVAASKQVEDSAKALQELGESLRRMVAEYKV